MIRNALITSACLSVLFFNSCGSASTNETTDTNEAVDTVATSSEEETYRTETVFILPSTVQIGSLFQKAGLEYVEGIANPTDKVGEYNTKTKKLMNFGVYSADLSYAVLNNQNQASLDYMKTVKILAEDVGFNEVYASDEMFERFEENLGNQDEILSILIDIQEKTDAYIEDNEQQDEALMIFTGAWVEGMYLGVNAMPTKEKSKITIRIIEQMTVLDNMLVGLKRIERKSPELIEVGKALEGLYRFYTNLPEVKDYDGPLSQMDIEYSNLNEMADRITTIRELIVK